MALTYRGPVVELQGQQFDPPEGISGAAAARWFEQQAAEQKARAEAKPKKVSVTPQPTSRELERLNALEESLRDLEGELQNLRDEQGPDVMQAAQVASTAAMLIDRQHILNNEAKALQEAMIPPLEAAQELVAKASEQLAQAERLKTETLGVLEANRDISNRAFDSYAKQLQEFRKQLTEAQYEFSELNRETKDTHKQVKSSLELTETAVAAGREAAAEAVDQQMDEFVAFASLVVRSLGLTEADLSQSLNAGSVRASEHFITRNYLAQAAALMKSWESTPGALADVVAAEEAVNPNPGPQLQN